MRRVPIVKQKEQSECLSSSFGKCAANMCERLPRGRLPSGCSDGSTGKANRIFHFTSAAHLGG